MIERKQGVTAEHSGACVSHDVSHLFSHFGFVAMYSAISAGCFSFLKQAFIETPVGVIQEVTAFSAEGIAGFMPSATIDAYHCLNSFFLSQHSSVFFSHNGPGIWQL
jgi:hypothetical protein